MQTTIGEIVKRMIKPINKTLDDVFNVEVTQEGQTVKSLTIIFNDNTKAVIEIEPPKKGNI